MKRPASVRAAVAHSREQRLRRMERTVGGYLRYLKRHDPEAHAAFVACLRRIVDSQRGLRGVTCFRTVEQLRRGRYGWVEVTAPIGHRIRRSATRLLGRQWHLPKLGRVTVIGPTTENLALIDQLWPDARHPSHVHGGWRWAAISKACEDRYVIASDGSDPQEPIAIWGSKSASTITLEGRSYYRLDFIEVRPSLRGEHPIAATFALATVAMRARERGATGVVLAAFSVEGVGRAYEARGAVRGCPKGWSCPSDLVPYMFEEPALERLERGIHELETAKAK